MKTPRIFSTLLLLGIAATGASAQNRTAGSDVVGAGGGISGNGNIVMRATAGQPAVGDVTAPATLLQQGFWLRSGKVTASAGSLERPATGLSLLIRAQPNPFAVSTELLVDIPVTGQVTVRLHDAGGNEVKTLIDGICRAGTMKVAVDGTHLPSGNYVVILTTEKGRATTTLRLVK